MKKSRLLEIIREEISGALNEAGLGDQISALQKQKDALEKKKAPIIKQEADISKKIADLEKKEADAEVKSSATLEEDTLNEEPDFAGAGGRFDKQVAAKYGEEDTLEAATEKVTNRVLSDKGITKADVAKMDAQELKALLKDIRAFISQKKQSPEVAAALEKQKEFDDSGSNLQDNQTNKAILRVLGFGSKKGPKGPTKSKEEKTTSASKAEPMDGEDKEATQNIGSDSTAKELGKKADVSKNPDFDRIRKGLQDKRKKSKDGILSPEDMKLAINIINTAKDKYKFNTTQVDSLRADIGL